jgi:hypothetical protein
MMLHTVIENFTDNPTKETAKAALNHLKKYPGDVGQVSAYNREWVAAVLGAGRKN